MVNNLWNMRQREVGRVRVVDSNRPWYRFASALLEYVPVEDKALDVGCGVGEFLGYLNARGFEAQGIDGSAEQIAVVVAHGQRGQVVDLEEALPFEDGRFGLVTCLEVIEHIAQAEFILKEIQRILKPNGFLLLSTPNFTFLTDRLHYLLGEPPKHEGIHLRFFTRDKLEKSLQSAGFRIVGRNSYGVLPFISSFESRILRRVPTLIGVPRVLEPTLSTDLVLLMQRGN